MQDTTAQIENDSVVEVEVESTYEFTYKLGARQWQFNREDILAFHASQKYVEVVLRDTTVRPIWEKSLGALIEDPRFSEDFVSIHRSTLIRLSSLWRVSRAPATSVFTATLEATKRFEYFPIARRKYPALKRLVGCVKVALTPEGSIVHTSTVADSCPQL